jgi:hypothetical protein
MCHRDLKTPIRSFKSSGTRLKTENIKRSLIFTVTHMDNQQPSIINIEVVTLLIIVKVQRLG